MPRQHDEFLLREVTHRLTDAMIVGRVPVADAMDLILRGIDAACPSPLNLRLRELDWAAAADGAIKDFRSIINAQRLPVQTRGLWFDMPDIALLGNPPIIRLAAYASFDPQATEAYVDNPIDWPAPGRFAAIEAVPALREVAEIMESGQGASDDNFEDEEHDRDDDEDGDEGGMTPLQHHVFACTLGFTCLIAAAIGESFSLSELLEQDDSEAAREDDEPSLGFVGGPSGGEFHRIGIRRGDGWHPKPESWLASASED